MLLKATILFNLPVCECVVPFWIFHVVVDFVLAKADPVARARAQSINVLLEVFCHILKLFSLLFVLYESLLFK